MAQLIVIANGFGEVKGAVFMRALSMATASKKEIAMGTYGVGTEIHAVDTELRSSVRPSIFAISLHSKMRATAPRVQRGFTEAVKGNSR